MILVTFYSKCEKVFLYMKNAYCNHKCLQRNERMINRHMKNAHLSPCITNHNSRTPTRIYMRSHKTRPRTTL